jgi:NTE family protein
MYKEKIKVGLSLSGGGARGFAHIGVIQALLEDGIQPDAISGASAGSVVGALYAAGYSPEEMLQFVKESNFLKLMKFGIPSGGLSKLTYLRERLSTVIDEDDFAGLKYPLSVAITNLNNGVLEIKEEGPLYDVIMASCSVPLVFQPVELDKKLYVDGGLLCNLPVQPLRDKMDFVIGVNLVPPVDVDHKTLSGVMSIAHRCFDLSIWANTQPQCELCDVLMEPKGITDFTIFQFNKYKEIYKVGYESAKAQMPTILKHLTPLMLSH